MIVLEEILVANSVGLLILIVSMLSRVEMKKEKHVSGKIFSAMLWITFFALIAETATFLLDGKAGTMVRFLHYVTNAYLFLASSCVGALWVMFVDLRIFHSILRVKKWFKIILVPYIILVVLIICDFFGVGIIFSINEQNVYQRGSFVFLSYAFVFGCV